MLDLLEFTDNMEITRLNSFNIINNSSKELSTIHKQLILEYAFPEVYKIAEFHDYGYRTTLIFDDLKIHINFGNYGIFVDDF
jgi:hypothetical protein